MVNKLEAEKYERKTLIDKKKEKKEKNYSTMHMYM